MWIINFGFVFKWLNVEDAPTFHGWSSSSFTFKLFSYIFIFFEVSPCIPQFSDRPNQENYGQLSICWEGHESPTFLEDHICPDTSFHKLICFRARYHWWWLEAQWGCFETELFWLVDVGSSFNCGHPVSNSIWKGWNQYFLFMDVSTN